MLQENTQIYREVCRQMSLFAEQKADKAHEEKNIAEEKEALDLRDNLLSIEDKLIGNLPLNHDEMKRLLAATITFKQVVEKRYKLYEKLVQSLGGKVDLLVRALKESNLEKIEEIFS